MSDSTSNNSNAGGTSANDTNKGTNTSGAADATKTDTGEGASVDTSKFTQADWDKVYADPKLYEHSRFKGLNEQAKKARELEEANKVAEEKRLTENKEFEKLAKVKEQEANTWKSRAEQATINNSILFEAQKLGVVDPEAVTKLIDRKDIKLGEDGTVTGVTESVKALIAAKPYLTSKSKSAPNLGSGTNPSDQDTTTPRFKLSQLNDHKFFMKHQAEIDQALKLGLVENDMNK